MNNDHVTGDFLSLKSKRKENVEHEDTSERSDTEELKTEQPDVRLFSCPEQGCVKQYQRYSYLQQHLESGEHTFVLEQEPLLDRAIFGYAERLEVPNVGVPTVQCTQDVLREISVQPTLSMGWALRSSQTRRTRFNARQKEYLMAKFNIGETTGCKADAVVVAWDMMNARDTDGERLFSRDEFLSSQQITSFFSRLTAKKSLSDITDDNDEDVNEADLKCGGKLHCSILLCLTVITSATLKSMTS